MGKVHVNPDRKIYLTGFDQKELIADLTSFLRETAQKPYRVKQVLGWLYHQAATDFESMDNLPASLRKELANRYAVLSLAVREHLRARDGAEKFLWETEEGHFVESVFMPAAKKTTLCVSSQVGCPLACTFCSTGKLVFRRNLEVHEIVSQVLGMRAERKSRTEISNVVFMGMGEPMLNYQNVLKAIRILNDPDLLQIGARRITVSTVGIPRGIKKIAEDLPQVKLAVSLNAPVDTLRDRLMPINRRYPLKQVIGAVRHFTERTGKRVTFEYIIIPGVNDSRPLALSLKKLIEGIPAKVNLIALNRPGPGAFRAPKPDEVRQFRDLLMEILPQSVTVRKSMGADICAACGQLAGAVSSKDH